MLAHWHLVLPGDPVLREGLLCLPWTRWWLAVPVGDRAEGGQGPSAELGRGEGLAGTPRPYCGAASVSFEGRGDGWSGALASQDH